MMASLDLQENKTRGLMGWVLQKSKGLLLLFLLGWGVLACCISQRHRDMGHILSLVSLAQLFRNNKATHKKLPQSDKRVPRQQVLCSLLFLLASNH